MASIAAARNLKRSFLIAAGLALMAGGLGLSHLAPEGGKVHAVEAAPLPVVETAVAEQVGLRQWTTFSGRLAAVEEALVRPLVGGTIQAVLFEEGARVEAGQPLFVIDPRPFEVALEEARASLAAARSKAELAQIEFDRAEKLLSRNTISRSLRDARANDLRTARAELESAAARVASAELNLEYAHIEAPIAGRIGRAEVTVGNVIEAGPSAPVLASVVANVRLYVEFDVDEASYFQALRDARKQEQKAGEALIPVEVTLAADAGAVYHGRLHAFDNQLDAVSGTIRARAILDNPDGVLIPGAFASVRLGNAMEEPALLVPARAIGVSQDKRFVYVVDETNRVQYREVIPGPAIDSRRVIEAGISAGEQVVVNGLQRVSSGMLVETVQLKPALATDRVSASL